MTVRSNHCNVFCCNIEINTVHHRTKFIIGSSKHRTVDTSQKYACFHFYADSIIPQCSRLREFIRILPHQAVFSVLVLHRYFIIIRIDIECEWLLRNFFQCVKQCFRYYGKRPFVSLSFTSTVVTIVVSLSDTVTDKVPSSNSKRKQSRIGSAFLN